MTLTKASPQDLASLLQLESTCFTTDRLTRRSLSRLLRSSSALVLVAKLENTLVGSAVVFYRKGSTTARLYSLAVDPKHRQHGFALALMQAVEKDAVQRGCTRMKLEVRKDNGRAIHFYEQGGYGRVGEIIAFYEDGADAWRMLKPLTPHETAAS